MPATRRARLRLLALERRLAPAAVPVAAVGVGTYAARVAGVDSASNELLFAGNAPAAVAIPAGSWAVPTSNVYFVSPTGLSTNSGTQASPWSVTKALEGYGAPAGSTVVFLAGTYRTGDLSTTTGTESTVNRRLTLQPFPGAEVWFDGSDVVTGFTATGGVWAKAGWTYSFPGTPGDLSVDPVTPLAGYRDQVYRDGASLAQVGTLAEVTAGTFYVDAANAVLYVGDDPAGHTVEATTRNRGLTLYSSAADAAGAATIRGLGFRRYANEGLSGSAAGATVEGCAFAWNGIVGFGLAYGATDMVVRNNAFVANGRKGFTAGGDYDRLLLQGNAFAYNNVEKFATFWDAGGLKVTGTNHLRFDANLVERNYCTGFWSDVSVLDTVAVRNLVRRNTTGLFFEISSRAVYAGNLLVDNSVGVYLSGSNGAQVVNNTFVGNSTNFLVKDTTRVNDVYVDDGVTGGGGAPDDNPNEGGESAQDQVSGNTWVAAGNVVQNNVFSDSRSSTGVLFNAGTPAGSATSLSMFAAGGVNGNAYWRSATTQFTTQWDAGSGGGVNYATLAAFHAAGTAYAPVEATNYDFGAGGTNPFFADAANGDYRLAPGSSLVGRGLPLSAVVLDALGLPAEATVGLGAYGVAGAVVAAADGTVVIEAEAYHANTPRGPASWAALADGSAGGGKALQAVPDAGGFYTAADALAGAPRLDYRVVFPAAGTYNVWVRGRGPDTAGDSVHVGLDGQLGSTADNITGFPTTFGWSHTTMDGGAVATLTVPAAGLHTVNVWLREGGFVFDRLALTPATTTFSGAGPASSPLSYATPTLDAGPDASVVRNATFAGTGYFAGGAGWAVTVSYGDGSAPVAVTPAADGTLAFNHVYATAGTYTLAVAARNATTNEAAADSRQVAVRPGLGVATIRVNTELVQRSRVTELSALFDGPATLGGTAFQLRNGAGQTVPLTVTPRTADGRTTAVLTFSGTGVIGGSLPDGDYTLTVRGAGVTDAAGQPVAGDTTLGFHRQYGDFDGDHDVDAIDLLNFQGTYLRPDVPDKPGVLTLFDGDGDGDVDTADAVLFKAALDPAYPVNFRPRISDLGNRTVAQGGTTGAIAFTVGDPELAAGTVSVTLTSSNPVLLPATGLNLVSGGNGSWSYTLTPAAGQFGSGSVTLTARDGAGQTTTESFVLTVTPATTTTNTPPTVTAINSKAARAGVSTGNLAFTVADAETAAGSLTVTAATSNPTLVPLSAITLTAGANGAYSVAVTPAAGQAGVAVVSVVVSDGAGGSVSEPFFVTVGPPPGVQYVEVNGGATQRSEVTGVTVVFNEVVTLAAGAFTLTRDAANGGGGPAVSFTTRVIDGHTVAELAFASATGFTLDGPSLLDGRYTLTVVASKVGDAAGNAFTGSAGAGSNYVTASVHRLLGDADGDAAVDGNDLAALAQAFNSVAGDPAYRWWLDFDRDGAIDGNDLGAFAQRFNTVV